MKAINLYEIKNMFTQNKDTKEWFKIINSSREFDDNNKKILFYYLDNGEKVEFGKEYSFEVELLKPNEYQAILEKYPSINNANKFQSILYRQICENELEELIFLEDKINEIKNRIRLRSNII